MVTGDNGRDGAAAASEPAPSPSEISGDEISRDDPVDDGWIRIAAGPTANTLLPCPPLCGARFSPTGRLLFFSNTAFLEKHKPSGYETLPRSYADLLQTLRLEQEKDERATATEGFDGDEDYVGESNTFPHRLHFTQDAAPLPAAVDAAAFRHRRESITGKRRL
jgi:hypothetical protein